jgi:hypothetical protein
MAKLERLEHLKTVARNIPQERLRMDIYFTDAEPNTLKCGLVACLGGHAALDPVFNSLGLTTVVGDDGEVGIVLTGKGPGYDPFDLDPIDLLIEFFGLTNFEANYLFMPAFYDTIYDQQPTNDELVEHIDHVIDGVYPDEDENEGTES